MEYYVDKVNWLKTKKELKQIRKMVFVYEMRFPIETEFDALDLQADHIIIKDQYNLPIGTARLCPDGLISRLAVIQSHRNRESLNSLINYTLNLAKQKGLEDVFVHCALERVSNFEEHGFARQGFVFMEAGIPIQKLRCPVSDFRAELFSTLH